MRVRAKRHSTSKRMSTTPRTADVSKRHPTSKEQPPLPPIPDTESNPQIPKATNTNTGVSVDKDLPKQPQLQVQEPTVAEDAPINLPKPIFKPNFNTAEMERRRRARMEMRGRFANPQPVGPPRPIIDSSDEEEPPPRKVEPEEVPEEMPEQTPEEEPEPTPTAASFDDEESSASDEFEIVGASVVHHDMEDADEFDPCVYLACYIQCTSSYLMITYLASLLPIVLAASLTVLLRFSLSFQMEQILYPILLPCFHPPAPVLVLALSTVLNVGAANPDNDLSTQLAFHSRC